MANTVYDTEEFSLLDGTEVTLTPLPIARLRRFLKAWDKAKELPKDDDGFDVFIDCSGIALEHNFKGKFDYLTPTPEELSDLDKDDEKPVLSKQYADYLKETLELPTIYRILKVVGGIDFEDPKLRQMLMEAAAAQDGTSSTS
jgi:hypothetical protein